MVVRDEPKTALQAKLTSGSQSSLDKYRDLVVGQRSLWALVRYEFITLIAAHLPGGLGYVLRKILYRYLLGSVGRAVVFGRGVILRHPHKIHIGDGTIIDDGCVLDAKGDGNRGIQIGKNVILARRTVLSCKDGDIEIGDNSNISMNCLIHSESLVRLGSNVLFAAYCYLVGGGAHDFDRIDVPIIQQGSTSCGIVVEDGAWFGARVTLLDGVRIGHDAVVGAAAVVKADIPAYAVAVGIPARVVRSRAPGISPPAADSAE